MSHKVLIGLVMGCVSVLALSAAESDATIQPGRWQSTETVSVMVNPLMSDTQVAKRLSTPAVVTFCVTSPSVRDMLVGSDKNGLCSGNVTIANGKISGSRSCTTGLGKGTRTMEGTYTATTVDTLRETNQETPKGPAHTKSRIVSTRIGDCT